MTPEDTAQWTRHFAIDSNNRAWRLAEQESRTPAEDAEMLNAAHAAALHWGKVGTELHNARATMLLGHVHALLRHGASAKTYAQQAFDFVTSRESPPWEVAFAHAVLANAAFAAGDNALHAKHHKMAATLAAALTDPEDREIFDATFKVVPKPA